MPSWLEVTVEVPSELGEVAASILFDLGSPGLECVDHGSMTSLVAYFREPPKLDDLRRLCSVAGAETGREFSPSIRTRSIDEQDWAEDWKRNFRSTAIGRRLVISPPWDLPATNDRIVIVIEPAMAFGTGQHPTTRACLELIENAVTTRGVFSAADVGTGSGILAIALAKLGVESVYAIDNDPTARAAATANCERNGCTAVRIADEWRNVEGPCDLIVANLFTNLLRDLARDLQRLLAPNGLFICSGFLTSDEGTVLAAYTGFDVVNRRDEDGWVTLALTRSERS